MRDNPRCDTHPLGLRVPCVTLVRVATTELWCFFLKMPVRWQIYLCTSNAKMTACAIPLLHLLCVVPFLARKSVVRVWSASEPPCFCVCVFLFVCVCRFFNAHTHIHTCDCSHQRGTRRCCYWNKSTPQSGDILVCACSFLSPAVLCA